MMKSLQNSIKDLDYLKVIGTLERDYNSVIFDSRKAKSNAVFVAMIGTKSNGHDYIENVIENGCTIIVCQKDYQFSTNENVTYIIVENTNLALAQLAANFYGHPSKQLKLIGITGTNGKTTTTTLLHQLFSKLGYHVGLLSTVVNKIGDKNLESTHTTPDAVSLNALLADMVEEGCSHCFMEVSSHAIHQNRIGALQFSGGIFTNITHDHLDYHKTFAEYRDVKKTFFDDIPKTAFALSNIDDKNGEFVLQNTKAKTHTYSLHNVADFKAKVIENQFSGLVLQIDGTEVWSHLIGEFNASNLLAVYACATLLNEDKIEILTAISELRSVDGRFQYVRSSTGIIAIIDYAHTPDALENVLKTIANIRSKNENVITIIGCGGDRDKTKRPIMAEIACNLSDKVIFTSDNPRSENADTIIDEMNAGVPGQHFKKTTNITDRSQAIKSAVAQAQPKDIILIAGKGHETYQEINGVKHDFDDKKIVVEMFNKMEK